MIYLTFSFYILCRFFYWYAANKNAADTAIVRERRELALSVSDCCALLALVSLLATVAHWWVYG